MIEHLAITIEPVTYTDGVKELRIHTFMDGQEYHTRQILRNDELQSFFEQIWERAGREVLARLRAAQQNMHLTAGTCPHLSAEFDYICARCMQLVPASRK
jgi:hypothetical protein